VNLDLDPLHLSEVKRILGRTVPGIPVWAFGSRIAGKAKRFSDLDLALAPGKPMPKETIWELRESFSESDLPFRVDVIDLASVSRDFRASVEKRHLPLQGD
jgi:uncharacterized protein